MAAEATHGHDPAMSFDLSKAAAKVRDCTDARVHSQSYVYADNVAEPGSPIFAPLAAVETGIGVIYFNSKGDAFAEENSSAMQALQSEAGPATPSGAMHLKKLRPRTGGK